MAKKINCPNCGKKVEDWLVYCEFCGQVLQKEKKGKYQTEPLPVKPNVIVKDIPSDGTSEAKRVVIVPRAEDHQDRKWYRPLKRKRPWYNPLEWFFWIGWSFYVIFRVIAVETLRYLKWCVCWGRPEESKRNKK